MKRWVLLVLSLALGQMCWPSSSVGVADLAISGPPGAKRARVVIVQGTDAIVAFNTRKEVVRPMVNCGLTNLTGKTSVKAAWLSLVSTQDVIGIKVFASPGAISGTRPAVVSGVVQGLLEAGVPREKIIIWDKRIVDLRLSGFMDLAKRYGVSVAGAAEEGYDDATAYDTALIGRLVWGDHEFGKKGEGIGRKSFVSNLVAHRLTKIINVTPMLNHNIVGVSGTIYGLTMASVDNTLRFDGDPERLATAAPEIYALRAVGDNSQRADRRRPAPLLRPGTAPRRLRAGRQEV